jgi:cell fate (sporulation/competence/biofilm development) regulator YmcA (YheA/YmcA/DUF963 family)
MAKKEPKLTNHQQQIADAKELDRLHKAQPALLKSISGIWESINKSISKSVDASGNLVKEEKAFVDLSRKVLGNTKDLHKEVVDWAGISEKITEAYQKGDDVLVDQYKHLQKIQGSQKRYNNLVNAGANSLSKMVGSIDSTIRSLPLIGDFIADSINFDDMSKNMTSTFREGASLWKEGLYQGTVEGITSGIAEETKLGSNLIGASAIKGISGFTIDHTDLDIMKAHNKGSKSYQQAEKRHAAKIITKFKAMSTAGKLAMGAVAGLAAGMALALKTMIGFAQETGLSYRQIENIGGSLFINKKYVTAMAEEFGTINDVNAKTAWQLKKQEFFYGIQSEQAVKILRLQTAISGKSNEQLINLQKEVAIAARLAGVLPAKLFEDIANSTEIFAKFAKDGGKELMMAAVHAKTLGLNLGVADQIAEHLLNIEGSINAQFEASAVIGRELNFDKARQLALTGQLGPMLDEVKRQVGGELEFNKMNVVQRDLLSKAIGTDITNLAKLTTEQEKAQKVAAKNTSSFSSIAGMAGALIAGILAMTFGAPIMGALAAMAGVGAIAGFTGGAILPQFATLPQGMGVDIRRGQAIADPGETIVHTTDMNSNMNETNRLLGELIKRTDRGQTKIYRSIEDMG